MSFTVKQLSPAGASEVKGLDVRNGIGDEDMSRLRDVFRLSPILCMRDQDLSPTQQANFSRQWGPLEKQGKSDYCHPDDADILILSNERRADGSQVGIVDAGDFWHSDSSHMEEPCQMTMLLAVKNPEKGGDTHFINMYQAYEVMPEALKARIVGRSAIHHSSKTLNPRVTISAERANATEYYKSSEKMKKPVIQPMVRTHPATGRQSLYVSPRFTIGIDGMDDAEAQPLLDEVFRHMFSSQAWQYTHKWKDGDLVFWDNACLNHMAGGGYEYPDTRRMHRTTIAGGKAFYEPEPAKT